MQSSPLSRPRRGLLVGGASALLGAAAVALGQDRAEAAGPAPLLRGRGNVAGAASTGITATTTSARAVLVLLQRGAGLGLTVTSSATAVLGAAAGGTAWGLWGRSTATRAGTG